MQPSILIMTMEGDLHAVAVEEALLRRGIRPVVWYTSDYPRLGADTARFAGGGARWEVRGPEMDLAASRFDTVWYRRFTYATDLAAVHPRDRAFATRQTELYRRGLYALLGEGAFCVNPYGPGLLAEAKVFQQHVAGRVGLETPATLFSNDPGAVRAFVREQGGRVAYKPMQAYVWNEGGALTTFTTTVADEDLGPDALLRAAPGIYQAVVPKAYELRVTVIGRRVLAARVHSQETETGRMDWRKSYHELQMSATELPPPVEAALLRFMERMGLVFGCVDFIVTPEGKHVFLEVNQAGQFLFIEMFTGLPVLDAFVEMLAQGRPDFAWDPASPRVRYEDIEALCLQRNAERSAVHPPMPEPGAAKTAAAPRPEHAAASGDSTPVPGSVAASV